MATARVFTAADQPVNINPQGQANPAGCSIENGQNVTFTNNSGSPISILFAQTAISKKKVFDDISNLASGSQYTEAPLGARQHFELTPSYPAYANLGQLYYLQKRYIESASMTEQALKLNNNNYLVWNNLVNAYEWLKEKDKAATARARATELAEKSAKLNPQDALAQAKLASFYAQQNLREKAMTRIQTALALSPDDPAILYDVATSFEYLGDRRQAIQYAQRAIQKGYPFAQLANDPDMQSLILDPNLRPKAK